MTKAEVTVRFDCSMNEGETVEDIETFVVEELEASGIIDGGSADIVEIRIVEVDDD